MSKNKWSSVVPQSWCSGQMQIVIMKTEWPPRHLSSGEARNMTLGGNEWRMEHVRAIMVMCSKLVIPCAGAILVTSYKYIHQINVTTRIYMYKCIFIHDATSLHISYRSTIGLKDTCYILMVTNITYLFF